MTNKHKVSDIGNHCKYITEELEESEKKFEDALKSFREKKVNIKKLKGCFHIEGLIESRDNDYGDFRINFLDIAKRWSSHLQVSVKASDVAIMMIELKLARVKSGIYNKDNYDDIQGYCRLAQQLQEEECDEEE